MCRSTSEEKKHEVGLNIVVHPVYSPDIAPFDFYLFCSLRTYFDQKSFAVERAFKIHVKHFLSSVQLCYSLTQF